MMTIMPPKEVVVGSMRKLLSDLGNNAGPNEMLMPATLALEKALCVLDEPPYCCTGVNNNNNNYRARVDNHDYDYYGGHRKRSRCRRAAAKHKTKQEHQQQHCVVHSPRNLNYVCDIKNTGNISNDGGSNNNASRAEPAGSARDEERIVVFPSIEWPLDNSSSSNSCDDLYEVDNDDNDKTEGEKGVVKGGRYNTTDNLVVHQQKICRRQWGNLVRSKACSDLTKQAATTSSSSTPTTKKGATNKCKQLQLLQPQHRRHHATVYASKAAGSAVTATTEKKRSSSRRRNFTSPSA